MRRYLDKLTTPTVFFNDLKNPQNLQSSQNEEEKYVQAFYLKNFIFTIAEY